MTRHPSTMNPVWLTVAVAAWLTATCFVPAPAQQETERQTRLLLPRTTAQAGPTLLLQAAHSGKVTCMSLRADGAKLVSGGMDGYAIIYDVEAGIVERTFPWHPCPLTSVSLSPDGHYLACGLQTGEVVIWDLKGKGEPRILDDLLRDPEVRYSPTGKCLAVCGGDPARGAEATVILCDPAGTEVLSRQQCLRLLGMAFSPGGDSLMALCLGDVRVADLTRLGAEDSDVQWQQRGRLTSPWQGRDGTRFYADRGVLGPSGSNMTVGGTEAAPSHESRWDAITQASYTHGYGRSGREWALIDLAAGKVTTRWERRGDVLAFAPDGSRVFEAGRERGQLSPLEGRLTDLRTGLTQTFMSGISTRGRSLSLEDTVAWDVVISTDGRRAIAAFDAQSGISHYPSYEDYGYGFDGSGAAQSNVGVATWDLETRELVDAWWVEPSREGVRRLLPAPGAENLLAVLASGRTVEWGLSGAGGPAPTPPGDTQAQRPPGMVLRSASALPRGTLSPDGRYVLMPQERGEAELDDARTGEEVAALQVPGGEGLSRPVALALWVSPYGRGALAAHLGTIETGSLPHERAVVRLRRYALPEGTVDLSVNLPAQWGLSTLGAFSPDGRRLVVCTEGSSAIWLWDLLDLSAPVVIGQPGHYVRSLCFSPDGSTLATGGADASVLIWEIGEPEPQARLNGHCGAVTGVCFTADGRLASGSSDGSVVLWDARDWLHQAMRRQLSARMEGRPLIPARAAADAAHALATGLLGWTRAAARPADAATQAPPPLSAVLFCFVQPPRNSVADVSDRDLWEARERGELEPDPDWLVAVPQGCYDCSPGASGRVAWMMGDRVYPFDQFESETRRPDVVKSVLAGQGVPAGAGLGMPHAPPELEFRSPAYGATAELPQTTITFATRGAKPVQRIALFVNGRPVGPSVAAQLVCAAPESGDGVFTCDLPIPSSAADLRLRAVAYDTDGLSSRPAELLLRVAGTGDAGGGLLVLSIGISKYRNNDWNTLQYADADATAFADLLSRRAGAVRDKQILVNAGADVASVLWALRRLKDMATENDTAAVFIAGHGVQGPGDDYYFLCHDSTETDLANTALPWSVFARLLAETRARRVMLFADTCHAGSVTGAGDVGRRAERLNGEGGVIVFAASKGDEASIEGDQWGHGAFTFALLEGLRGAADQSTVLREGKWRPNLRATAPPTGGNAQQPGQPGPPSVAGATSQATRGPDPPSEGTTLAPGVGGFLEQPYPQAPSTWAGQGANQVPPEPLPTTGAGPEGKGKAKITHLAQGDRVVTVGELAEYVAAKVVQLSEGRQHPLTRMDQFPADEPIAESGNRSGVQALAFSPDGRELLALDPGGAIWDLSQDPPAVAHRLDPPDQGAQGSLAACAYSPDGRWVATWDQTLSLWDAQTGALCDRWRPDPAARGPRSVGFNADATMLAYSSSQTSFAVVAVRTLGGGPVRGAFQSMGLDQLGAIGPAAGSAAFSGLGLPAEPGDAAAAVAPVRTPVAVLGQLLSGALGLEEPPPEPAARLTVPLGELRSGWSCVLPGGRLAHLAKEVAASGPGVVLYIREVPSGRVLRKLKLPGEPSAACISSDSGTAACLCSQVLSVLDTGSGRVLCALPEAKWGYTAMALSPDGATLATGTGNGAIQLRDARSGVLRVTLRTAADAPR